MCACVYVFMYNISLSENNKENYFSVSGKSVPYFRVPEDWKQKKDRNLKIKKKSNDSVVPDIH